MWVEMRELERERASEMRVGVERERESWLAKNKCDMTKIPFRVLF